MMAGSFAIRQSKNDSSAILMRIAATENGSLAGRMKS
jgi:hypothetical protein